jgi:hypothetical protein
VLGRRGGSSAGRCARLHRHHHLSAWSQQRYRAAILGSGVAIQEYVIITATNGAALNVRSRYPSPCRAIFQVSLATADPGDHHGRQPAQLNQHAVTRARNLAAVLYAAYHASLKCPFEQ